MGSSVPLIVKDLSKVFTTSSFFRRSRDSFTAVDRVSFQLNSGEILGILGPNGAGKTTTIYMLLGITEVSSGSISYFGRELQSYRSQIMQRVSFASTYMRLVGHLTLYENLAFYAQLYGVVGAEQTERIEYFLKRFGLWEIKDRKAGGLSAGENTRAILAKAFIPQPDVLLLDEPTAALDPDIAHEVRAFVLEQKKEKGASIIFTSHNMDEISKVCDRVLVMKGGAIIGQGTPASLAATVSRARINLVTGQGPKLLSFAQEKGLHTVTSEHYITIEIDEQSVAQFLTELTKRDIRYSQISIDKPDLTDYFIEMARETK